MYVFLNVCLIPYLSVNSKRTVTLSILVISWTEQLAQCLAQLEFNICRIDECVRAVNCQLFYSLTISLWSSLQLRPSWAILSKIQPWTRQYTLRWFTRESGFVFTHTHTHTQVYPYTCIYSSLPTGCEVASPWLVMRSILSRASWPSVSSLEKCLGSPLPLFALGSFFFVEF